ncbi:17876_t:CDS:2 [Funneliformis geosporum]|uniref:9124_t:CDS:1 n=1 Tax=Funneliformis geosporum TaxID=1117311 RepID=A0A9W4X2R8_9GLOM|nr:17876_t:CDS:2 [Funneliformis geosporum]CAI2182228.1 9124_t:CDS:2 [Funneliformis geosporum]
MPAKQSITKLPPELFVEFCAYLTPSDLFILSKVCRKFYCYLSAPNSFSTQQIWKKSRLKFMTNDLMPPPNGMNEKCYVELLITERGCQICKINKKCKIYWEFGVRCCSKCFSEKTIMVESYVDYPRDLLEIMPFINKYGNMYYWKERLDFDCDQYTSFFHGYLSNLQSWLDVKKNKFDSIMKYAKAKQKKNEVKKISFSSDWQCPNIPYV